ncbi:MAG: hypothetical protein ACM3NQ_21910 [Bacteroidales bacterium]
MRQLFRVIVCCSALLAVSAATAHAQYRQYKPDEQTSVGEAYHAEFSFDFWNPNPALTIASESLGIIGDEIDAVNDLGFTKSTFREMKVALRPAKKHKFRFEFTPITFSAETVLKRDIIYNGILYRASLPVNSELSWKQYGFSYEYDFVYQPRWYVGVVLGAKYTQVHTALESPVDREYNDVSAPIPAIGGVFRGYVLKNLAITAQYDYFNLPDNVDKKGRYDGKTNDLNIYGTFNFTNNIGANVGYRWMQVSYKVEHDNGDFSLKGFYAGAVARF